MKKQKQSKPKLSKAAQALNANNPLWERLQKNKKRTWKMWALVPKCKRFKPTFYYSLGAAKSWNVCMPDCDIKRVEVREI